MRHLSWTADWITWSFQSTRPHGVRLTQIQEKICRMYISIHAPAWSATAILNKSSACFLIILLITFSFLMNFSWYFKYFSWHRKYLCKISGANLPVLLCSLVIRTLKSRSNYYFQLFPDIIPFIFSVIGKKKQVSKFLFWNRIFVKNILKIIFVLYNVTIQYLF